MEKKLIFLIVGQNFQFHIQKKKKIHIQKKKKIHKEKFYRKL